MPAFFLLSIIASITFGQQYDQVIKTYENGQKMFEGKFKDGKVDGPYRFWYENGQMSFEENYKDGIKIGIWTGWFQNGQKSIEFDSGSDGKSISWFQNGQKSSERFYINGKVEGLETYWYGSGQKYREVTYLDGELTAEKRWNEDGSVMKIEDFYLF